MEWGLKTGIGEWKISGRIWKVVFDELRALAVHRFIAYQGGKRTLSFQSDRETGLPKVMIDWVWTRPGTTKYSSNSKYSAFYEI